MEPRVIKRILTEELGADKQGSLFSIPKKTSVTALVDADEGLMPVSEIEEIEFKDDFVTLTAEDERLFIDQYAFFALREDDLDERNPDKRPGFH